MADTTTLNYGLIKPEVGAIVGRDLWGGKLNDNFDDIDTLIKTATDLASAPFNGQLVFPATPNLSTNVNTLDDYEEGTWTPAWAASSGAFGSITYDTSTRGSYVKIGRIVFIASAVGVDRTESSG